MHIRSDIAEVVARNQRFHQQLIPGTALCMVRDIRSLRVAPSQPLNQWNMDIQLQAYLDDLAQRALTYFQRRASLQDDLLPAVTPWFGIAELSAYCSGPVVFEETTSFHQQTIEELSNLPDGLFPSNSIWHERVLGGMAYLKEKLQGQLFVMLRGAACPIDILNALRGNDMFYDFYDDEDMVVDLLNRSADALAIWMEQQYQAVDHVGDGVISGFEVWLPGHAFGHMAEDASVMCSPQQYNQFAKPATMRAVEKFDTIFMHTHSVGAHSIPDIASIPNIKLLEISSDPNAPRAIKLFESLEDKLPGIIPVLSVTPKEVMEHLPLLSRHASILWMDSDTLDEAREALAYVRKVLPPERSL